MQSVYSTAQADWIGIENSYLKPSLFTKDIISYLKPCNCVQTDYY